jgi:hypothetical protein
MLVLLLEARAAQMWWAPGEWLAVRRAHMCAHSTARALARAQFVPSREGGPPRLPVEIGTLAAQA